MTTKYDDIISDIYKDAYGSRPRGSFFWDNWNAMNEDQRDAEVDRLQDIIVEEMDREARMAQIAVQDFEQDVQHYLNLGASNRATALRWMTQLEVFYHEQDVEHWVWGQGILFTDYGRELVKELMEIVPIVEMEY